MLQKQDRAVTSSLLVSSLIGKQVVTCLNVTFTNITALDKYPSSGRTQVCSQNWAQITTDPWVLATVHGYQLELESRPVQHFPPPALHLSPQECSLVQKEIGKLLQKGAITPVKSVQGQFVSQIFVVPKKDGKFRPVVNLKALNRFMKRLHFKMEGVHLLKDLLQKGDWMVTIDLKDAYLSVPVAQEHRFFLRFTWGCQLFQFQCLPFGLSTAPRVFTKIMKPVIALLRQQGIRVIIFLDDMLLMAQKREDLLAITQEVITLLHLLGFIINWDKSSLTPSQQIHFLGFMIDSVLMTMSLPKEKVKNIARSCQAVLKQETVTVRDLSRVLGRMTAASQAVLPAPLCYRNLQRVRNLAYARAQSYEAVVALDTPAKEELRWWNQFMEDWNGKAILAPKPQLTIESDASLLGWGAHCGGVSTGGLWSPEERCRHINCLELMGASLAVKTFAKDRENLNIRLRMDNTTAIAYVNRMGGTHSHQLSAIASSLWQWCLQRRILLSAEHLPGAQNVSADAESRTLPSSAEWKLQKEVFQWILDLMGPCQVDLFATRLNHQLPHYVSWKPDPHAIATDAFEMTWSDVQGYAFPPFSLVGRCLRKVIREGCTIVLIAPVWPAQAWFPILLECLIEYPVLLPKHRQLLTDPFNRLHPLLEKGQLQLAAWKVSGNATLQQAFRTELPGLSLPVGARLPTRHISHLGSDGIAGVLREKLIPFHAMSVTSWTS